MILMKINLYSSLEKLNFLIKKSKNNNNFIDKNIFKLFDSPKQKFFKLKKAFKNKKILL